MNLIIILNMIFSKFLKSMKTHSYLLQYLVAIFPIFLVFWILWQITMLSKYNAISFFSWGQVLNDTSVLLLPVIVLFLWTFSSYIYFSIKTTKKEKTWSLVILFLFFIVVWSIFSWIFRNNYFTSFICSFFLWYLCYIVNILMKDRWKNPSKNDNYIIPMIMNLFVLLVIFLFWFVLNYFYSFLYKNIEVKIDNEIHKINYMNDKYIFYSIWSEVKIIPNDGKNEFIIKNLFP